jgi:hypothetical protein
MSFRCHFVSFGAGRKGYGSALKRLKREIKRLDPDAQVWLFDERKVNQDIGGLDQSFSDFVRDNPRGFGLWVWKPWAVLEVMKSVQQGDIVFYLDAGCTVHTSINSKLRYEWYINHVREQGSLVFQQKFLEYSWTRREVIEHFHLTEIDVNSGQVMAGVQGHLVNEKQLKFVKDWLGACTLDSGRLLKDVGVLNIEDGRFIEHRHDASVFSCLAKFEGIQMIQDETFHHPKWNRDGDNFPFWTTRKISGLPRWMGCYAPRAWPYVVKSKLTRKPITKLVDPEYLANL